VKAQSVTEILALYDRHADEHYDEEISQLDHALQTAALAVADGASDELVVAALLHDVGHLLTLDGAPIDPAHTDDHHESQGAKYLSGLFPTEVTFPIALHVRAKRYLCAVDAAYYAGLSSGSKNSLELQGGAFEQGELNAFEQLAGAEGAVALRRWDDLGKVDGLGVAPIEEYRERLERVAAS
jgi:phosphonate degradation associated HDIG domain protein